MHPAFAQLAFIDGLGGPEMLLVFVLVLLLFGGQKLPEFARGLGKTMREFKKAAAGVEDEFKRALEDDERKKSHAALAAATPVAALAEPITVAPESAQTAGPDATSPSTPSSAGTPGPDPYHDHSAHDGYHEQDHYAEAGPESPGATLAAATSSDPDKPKSDNADALPAGSMTPPGPASAPPAPSAPAAATGAPEAARPASGGP